MTVYFIISCICVVAPVAMFLVVGDEPVSWYTLWVTGVVGVALFVAVLGSWGFKTWSARECNAYRDATSREIRLVHSGPLDWKCFAEVRGEWYPVDQIRSEDNG